MSQQACCNEAFPSAEHFQLGEDIDYLVPDATHSVGHLAIVPEMRFDCHGYITGLNALTQLDSSDAVIQHLNHDITFQLWRPSANDSGVYELVWSKVLDFIGDTIRDGLVTENGIQFFNFTSILPNDEQFYFQPGDVIGWYIHSTVQTIEPPLTIVYRHSSSSSHPGLQPVNMYTTMIEDTLWANTPPPCEVSLCSDQFTVISSVILYATVSYDGKRNNYVDRTLKFILFSP